MAQYDVSVTVTDSDTGDAIENASVDFGAASATTDVDGTATLTVEEGERAVNIDHADYNSISTVEVVDANNTTFSYAMDELYAVTVSVTDAADDTAISDASVSFDGKTTPTDANGNTSFELTAGTYDVDITHGDYYSHQTQETVDSSTTDFGYVLDELPEYDVTFTVEEAYSAEAIENASVTVIDGGTTEADLTTGTDGTATSTLQEGRYKFRIDKDGYQTTETHETVDDTSTSLTFGIEQSSYPGEGEDTHMLRFECSKPTTTPNPDQLFNSIDNWLDGFTEALPGQRSDVSFVEPDDGSETYVQGSYRFTIDESKANIIDQLEQRLQNHVEWYEIKYHVCDHGKNDRGGCEWDDVIEWDATA